MASLIPQASRVRCHNEGAARRDLEDLIELLLGEADVVEKNQRPLIPKVAPYLGVGRLLDAVALVERFEEELEKVGAGLMPGRQVDDAVVEGRGVRMMGDVAKESGLANAGFAAYLDREARFEGRQRRGKFRLAADEPPDDAWPQKDRRRPGSGTRPFL